jgi:YesN/AraC family two-component response regulator
MPGMGGPETFRELRSIRSDVKVILTSGYSEQEVNRRFLGEGIAGFIQKPYRLQELRSCLDRVLG